jgi:WD40-like Beta Propeller Repeat
MVAVSLRLLSRWIAGVGAGALVVLAIGGPAAGTAAETRAGAATGSIASPTWSPDGRSIAWSQLVPNVGRRIWVGTGTLSRAHPVTAPIDALGKIAWLPHSRLVYEANFRLFVLDLHTRKSVLISRFAGDTFVVDRRGDRIATGDAPCPLGCYGPVLVLDAHGRVVAKVGGAHVQNMSPSFSPTGRRIAFDRAFCDKNGRCDTPAGIWAASVASGALKRVTSSGICADWSPDGRSIVYIDPLAGSLRVVGAGGGPAATLQPGMSGCNLAFPPAWAPTSRNVAAVTWTTGALDVLDARTHRLRFGTALAIGVVTGFAWSPDSSRLLVAGQSGARACASLWLLNATTAGARLLRGCG